MCLETFVSKNPKEGVAKAALSSVQWILLIVNRLKTYSTSEWNLNSYPIKEKLFKDSYTCNYRHNERAYNRITKGKGGFDLYRCIT
jgi:hypothetical protein